MGVIWPIQGFRPRGKLTVQSVDSTGERTGDRSLSKPFYSNLGQYLLYQKTYYETRCMST